MGAGGSGSNYFYGGLSKERGSSTGNSIVIHNGSLINESGTWQAAGIYAAQGTGKGHAASDNSVTVNDGDFQGYTYLSQL